MKIISWNTNGIRATIKNGDFDPIFTKYKPDIMCFQETKCTVDQLPEEILKYKKYHSYFNSPALKKGYSGVAIYTKLEPKKVEYGMGLEKHDDEGRLITLYFDTPLSKNIKKWVLINGYFPNGGAGPARLRYKLRFYDEFLKFVNKKKKQGYAVIFCGDINTAHKEIDLARPKANEKNTGFLPIERAWIDKVIKNDYIDTFRHLNPDTKDMYTYWDQKTASRDRNVGWRIDYFFTSKDLIKSVSKSYMLTDYMGSDHCPLVLELK